jgi:hypothetical protein
MGLRFRKKVQLRDKCDEDYTMIGWFTLTGLCLYVVGLGTLCYFYGGAGAIIAALFSISSFFLIAGATGKSIQEETK